MCAHLYSINTRTMTSFKLGDVTQSGLGKRCMFSQAGINLSFFPGNCTCFSPRPSVGGLCHIRS